VSDLRKHRGPHPEDRRLFAAESLPRLCEATSDLSWLLTRGFAPVSALKLVGDRYGLRARQRMAVARCACSRQAATRRQQGGVDTADLKGHELHIDGYNVLTSVESALSGGVILRGRDGCYRDMASMHGTYRTVNETIPAIRLLGQLASQWRVAVCHWYLDQPVSNSGRLKAMLQQIAGQQDWNWQVELVPDPDRVLLCSNQIVATSDSQILDGDVRWCNFARLTIDREVPGAWIVDLSQAVAAEQRE
jgi:hypothetical protein